MKTVTNGSKYLGGIDREGNELDFVQLTASYEPSMRKYTCHNCKKVFEGSETFNEVKKHLGTFPID